MGSEMCIRDRPRCGHARAAQRRASSVHRGVARWRLGRLGYLSAGGARRQCLSSTQAVGLRRSPVGRRLMALRNPGTQHIPLSAGIAQEAAPMACRPMAEAFCSALTTTSASPPTVRWSSADDAAIEPTCPGLAHSAQAGLLAHGWAGHGRWCHDRAPSGARCAKAAIAFQLFVS